MRFLQATTMPDKHAPGLAQDLSFCLIGDQPVFLDLRSDSYFMLGASEAAALRQTAAGAVPDPRQVSILEDAGIVTPQPCPRPIEAARARPAEWSLIECGTPAGASASLAILMTAELLRLTTRLRLGGLAALIHALRAIKPDGRSPPHQVHQQALRFAASRRCIPIAASCLPDSLALAFHLARRGLAAELVLGAKLEPFAAHAWVQHEAVVLNDGLDGPLDFTPILVV